MFHNLTSKDDKDKSRGSHMYIHESPCVVLAAFTEPEGYFSAIKRDISSGEKTFRHQREQRKKEQFDKAEAQNGREHNRRQNRASFIIHL